MAFGNLTVDFRKLSKIPVRDRVTLAKSPVGSEIFGNLTPSQIAALFPDYYKKFIPASAGGTSLASGMTGAGYTGGGSAPTTGGGTSGGATPAPTGPVVPALIQEIYDAAGPMPDRYGGGSTNGQIEVLKFARRWGISPQAAAGVLRIESGIRSNIQGGGGNNYYGVFQLEGKQIPGLTEKAGLGRLSPKQYKKLSLADQFRVMDEYYKQWGVQPGFFTGDPKKDAAKMWALQLAPGNAKKIDYDDPNAVISKTKQASKIMSSGGYVSVGSAAAGSIPGGEEYLKDAEQQGLPGTEPITGEAPQGSDVGIEQIGSDGTATVVPQTQSFDPAIFTQLDPRIQEYYNTATEDQKKQLEYALMKTGVAKVNEIAQRHPRATADVVTTTVVQDAQQSAMNVSEAINQDPLEFWKARNPQGARIEDLDQETLRTAMMAAIKLEADMTAKGAPKKVEIYGPISGVRTDPKLEKSRHGLNFKEALDVAIYDVDPNTGQKIEKGMPGAKSGPYGNYPNIPGHGGIDPEGFALYHEFGQNAELARMFLANRGDERYQGWGIRQGQLFSAKGAQYDFMHIDRSAGVNPETGVSTHVAPHGVGSVAGGMTEAGVRKLGIDPNSDAGRRLMTGVTERFGKTRQDIALYAEAAYGPRPGVETTATQSLPGTESQTQTAPTIDTQIEPIGQADTNMALGGTRSTDVEPNMVNEKYTIAQTDPKTGETKPIANFNKNEEVNIKDGQMDVESSYKKQAKETGDKNDKGMQQTNHYTMRQSSSKNVPNLLHETTVQPSPSLQRAFRNSRFSDHFSYGSRNTDT